MTVELRPMGVHCNIQCQYCYQNPQRDAGNFLHAYNMERMKEALRAEGGPFTLFGGEPLLLPLCDLEEIWSWGHAQFGRNGIQTNGSLIGDEHIALFKRYNVQIGISIDGPAELNDARWVGTLERTREATARTERAIARLCEERIPPSLIITLQRTNAAQERLPILCAWLRHLETLGIRWVRLHLLESDNIQVRAKYALTASENITALLGFLAMEKDLTTLRFDLFDDMRKMLLGQDEHTTCIWNACDPYTTRAVRGIEGNGQRSNCGRTNKDGIDFVKSTKAGYERYLALYSTPQDAGGCSGCRFFLVQGPVSGNCYRWGLA
jgi:uncharacterized protein